MSISDADKTLEFPDLQARMRKPVPKPAAPKPSSRDPKPAQPSTGGRVWVLPPRAGDFQGAGPSGACAVNSGNDAATGKVVSGQEGNRGAAGVARGATGDAAETLSVASVRKVRARPVLHPLLTGFGAVSVTFLQTWFDEGSDGQAKHRPD